MSRIAGGRKLNGSAMFYGISTVRTLASRALSFSTRPRKWISSALRLTLRKMLAPRSHALLGAALFVAIPACSQAPTTASKPILAAPPPRDDGKAAKGGNGGNEHAAAVEQLKVAGIVARIDQQASVRIPLPDGANWTRVRFWSVPSLVGFRYGKDHHAILAAFVAKVDEANWREGCTKSFEGWANPWMEAFEVELEEDPPAPFTWQKEALEVRPVFARTATIAEREAYAAAYAVYPAWKGSCLIVGMAIPSRGDDERAREARDRFVREILPHVEVLAKEEPKLRF